MLYIIFVAVAIILCAVDLSSGRYTTDAATPPAWTPEEAPQPPRMPRNPRKLDRVSTAIRDARARATYRNPYTFKPYPIQRPRARMRAKPADYTPQHRPGNPLARSGNPRRL